MVAQVKRAMDLIPLLAGMTAGREGSRCMMHAVRIQCWCGQGDSMLWYGLMICWAERQPLFCVGPECARQCAGKPDGPSILEVNMHLDSLSWLYARSHTTQIRAHQLSFRPTTALARLIITTSHTYAAISSC